MAVTMHSYTAVTVLMNRSDAFGLLFLTRVVGLSSGAMLKDMGLRTTLRLAQPHTLR